MTHANVRTIGLFPIALSLTMPTLFNALLLSSSSWLDRLADMVGPSLDHGPIVGRCAAGLVSAVSPAAVKARPGAQAHTVAPVLTRDDRPQLAQVRLRITQARARLNPVRRLARVRSAPDDACRTVISGRMGEVCDLLDQLVARDLVAREAATIRRHAGTPTQR
jgi:hypothetical protein